MTKASPSTAELTSLVRHTKLGSPAVTAALSLASQTSSSPHMPCIDEKLWPSANGTDDFPQAMKEGDYEEHHEAG